MHKVIQLPNTFSFMDHGVYDFDHIINAFDWDATPKTLTLDFSKCFRANYQALSLFTLYAWYIHVRGARINFKFTNDFEGASKMWRLMGAVGWHNVLESETDNFNGNRFKPLIAIRNQNDFSMALSNVESYTKGFNVEYEKTLRYVITELLYNTLEHGKAFVDIHNSTTKRIPSLMQFTWYKERNELQFIIADLGIGIKKHLEQTYPPFESHADAVKYAIRPQVSGTFGVSDPYKSKDNAGVGLFISSSIIRRLNADMHIVSGNGLLHISPSDITSKTLRYNWPGTLVLVNVKLGKDANFILHRLMSEFREAALSELSVGISKENNNKVNVNIQNYFGTHAEDKSSAISYRDRYLIPAVAENKNIVLDFNNVISAPHSFLSALLATPIKQMGMVAFKKIKIVNAEPEIRETIDYILDENTA